MLEGFIKLNNNAIKKRPFGLLSLPWARLELALSYSPNWILSPTRLPIPPPGLIKFSS